MRNFVHHFLHEELKMNSKETLECQQNVTAEKYCHGNYKTKHHHKCVIWCKTGLRGTKHTRHDFADKVRNHVDNAIDHVFIEKADNLAAQSRQRGRAVHQPVKNSRVKGINTA